MLSFPSFEGVCFGFKPLGHDNYSQWEPSMRHLLSIQGIWEIVNGQVTKSELNHQGFELRDRLALALIQATVDLHVHPWVSGQFTSSKELWDSIKCKLQRKKKQKTKKKKKEKEKEKEKKQEPALVVRSEISHFKLPVPEIYDSPSDSNCLENILEEAAYMGNAQVLDQSDLTTASKTSTEALGEQDFISCEGHTNLLHEQDDLQSLFQIFKDVAAQRDEGTTVLRDKDEGYLLEVEENGIESAPFDQLSQDIIQQLEVPIIDDYFEVAGLSSLVQSFMYIPDYAATGLISECTCMSFPCNYESMYKKFELSMVSLDVVLEHPVHVADLPDELIPDFPWMDIHEQIDIHEEQISDLPWLNVDETTSDFASIMSQVQQQQLDLSLYICLNVPFSCTHGENLEDHPNLDHCLGYISYPEIGGLTKQLKVNYRCLHLRNQVLLVLEDSDLSMHEENLLAAEDSHEIMELHSAGQFSEFQDDISKFSFDSHQTEWFFYIRQNLVMNDTRVGKKREWFRGRKTWFKTRNFWQPWFLLWLSLLYLMSTA